MQTRETFAAALPALELVPWQRLSMRDAAHDVGEEDSMIVVVVGVTVNVDNVVSVSTSATAGDCQMSQGRGLLRRQVQIAQH